MSFKTIESEKIVLFLYKYEVSIHPLTDSIMTKKLRRSSDKMIAGVCGGIAEFFDIDSTWVRIGFALLTIFSAAFPGILVYLVMWLVIPKSEDGI